MIYWCVDQLTFDEHLAVLSQVLERLQVAGLKLKLAKCQFGRQNLRFLGHIVSKDGLSPDSQKTQAISDYPKPSNLVQLKQFLGLASYYRRFVQDFSAVAAPLTALTCKDTPWMWTSICQSAFDTLKQALTSPPVLAFPDFSQPFILQTDASDLGLGAVLAQQQQNEERPTLAVD